MVKQIRVAFILTMPYDIDWDKDGCIHCVFGEFTQQYFSDHINNIIGTWTHICDSDKVMQLSSKVVDSAESQKLNRSNKGFCGYNWMINDILRYGEILSKEDRLKKGEIKYE